MDYDELRTIAGDFLGYGTDPSAFSAKASAHVERMLKIGYRNFLYHSMAEPEATVYVWSFFKPLRKLQTISGQADYEMPEDFGGIEGDLTFERDDNYCEIIMVPEQRIRQLRQMNYADSPPCEAAIVVLESDGTSPQRFQLMLHPTPDAVYTLTYRCNVNPRPLSATNPYTICGPEHAETLKEAILAACEKDLDDTQGIHAAAYQSLLAGSIARDRKTKSAEWIGSMNEGGSILAEISRNRRYVTFNGVDPTV